MNTAFDAQSGKTYKEAIEDKEFWGRLVESAIGSHLANGIRGTQIELFYWREGDREVDFILQKGNSLTAIEVKSSSKKEKLSGLEAFDKAFHPSKILFSWTRGNSPRRIFKKTG